MKDIINDLISVIIPIYNREKVLHKSVDSILNQTYKKLEIILVDDGSTDNSGIICRNYAKQDSRVRVIHQENNGVSSARNIGTKNSTGEFIYYLDSDDVASPHLLEKFHDDLVKYEADCAFCGLRMSNGYIDDFELLGDTIEVSDWKNAYSMHMFDGKFNWTPGTHFYRRSVVMEPDQIMFRENCNYGEDRMWFADVIQRCNKAVADSSILLLYICGSDNSLTQNATIGMQYNSKREGYKFLVEHDFPQEQIDAVSREIDHMLISLLFNNSASEKEEDTNGLKKIETVKEVQKICLEILKFFDKLCRENNLTYFLCGGTLLGAIRHNGFIPWDDDVDVCMPRNDFDRMIEIMNGYSDRYRLLYPGCSNDYYYTFGKIVDNSTILRECGYSRIQGLGVYIDIFPLDGLPDDNKRQKHFIEAVQTRSMINSFAIKNPSLMLERRMYLCKMQNQLKELSKKYDFYSSPKSFINHGSDCTRTICDRKAYGEGEECFFEGCSFRIPRDSDAILTNAYGNYMELPPEDKRISNHNFDAWHKE